MNALIAAIYIGPALLLYAGAGVVLLADLVRGRRAPTGLIALVALGLAVFWTVFQVGTGAEGPILHGAIVADRFSQFFTFLLIAVTAAVIVATSEWAATIEDRGDQRVHETPSMMRAIGAMPASTACVSSGG